MTDDLKLLKWQCQACKEAGIPLTVAPDYILQLLDEIQRLQGENENLRVYAAKALVKFADASSEAERLKIDLSHVYDVGLPGLPPRDVDPQLYEDLDL